MGLQTVAFTFRGPRGREVFSQWKQQVQILGRDRAYNTRETKSILGLSLYTDREGRMRSNESRETCKD